MMDPVHDAASILNLDLDAFYASVEQRDKQSLRGKPVVVGGVGPRGVVATASYEARRFGIRSAMSTAEARARCPHAAFLGTRFAVYHEASAAVMTVLRAVSALVEPLSLDEAYVDLAAATSSRDLSPTGLAAVAAELKAAVHDVTGGLTASVGIASSKLVAKIASELDKPDGAVVVPTGTEQELMRPMGVRVLPGVGPATAARLHQVGVDTVSDLQQLSESELTRVLGQSHGAGLYLLSRGIDRRRVEAHREVKSISVEDTFEHDLVEPTVLAAIVDRHARQVAHRLGEARLSGRTVTVKVRRHDFSTQTRSTTLPGPTDRPAVVSRLARELLRELDTSAGVRLLGVGVSSLTDWVQDDLFDSDGDDDSADDSADDLGPPAAAVARSEPGGVQWRPGMDVHHEMHGAGWVWGSGLGRVTVRFETAATGSGPVRSFAANDPQLTVPGPVRSDQ